MPTKNSAWSLPRVLASVRGLAYPRDRLKLVFVDDCSTDATHAILTDWAQRHRRDFHDVVVVQAPTNIPQARNRCLRLAEGEYVLFWDSDVIAPSPDFLGRLLAIMRDNAEVGAIGCSYISANRGISSRLLPPPVATSTHAVYLGFTLIRHRVFDVVGPFNEDMEVGEDTEFFIRLGAKTRYTVRWAPEPCLHLSPDAPSAGTEARKDTASLRWLRYNFDTRARQYLAQYRNLPRILKLRIVYYFLLPPVVLLTVILSLHRVVYAGLTVLYIAPSLALECRSRGIRRGLYTYLATNIPTGVALSYGFVQKLIAKR